jgi:uncharacterized membrane protein
MRNRWFGPLCIAAMLAFGAVVYNQLPARVPSHWNIFGQVDQTTDPRSAVLVLPAIAVGVWLLITLLPRIDPLRASYSKFEGTFRLFINMIVLFLAVLYAAMLGSALGWEQATSHVAAIGGGILFAVLGNELGRVQPNWFVGIRTPWTLADPEVWRQTHRVGGRALFVTGLLIVVLALLLPISVATVVMVVGLMGWAALTVVYSYLLWRQREGA